MTLTEENDYGVTMYPVVTPSGGDLSLLTSEEADWYCERRDQYMKQNKFTNQSDLADLDRVLLMETMINRWSTWMSRGFDYMQARVDERQVQKSISDYSKELRQVKKALGIDKATRDKDKQDSVGDFIENLLRRAKEFGVHRNQQYEKAVTLIYEVKAMVRMHDKCDEEERKELDLSPESIMEWIRTNMVEEWDEIDEAFRENQKTWIREMS